MIEIKDIKDGDSLKEWLAGWLEENRLGDKAVREIYVTIAHRSAMRSAPFWWQWSLTNDAFIHDVTALTVLRACLISGVAAKMPTPEIKTASSLAKSSSFSLRSSPPFNSSYIMSLSSPSFTPDTTTAHFSLSAASAAASAASTYDDSNITAAAIVAAVSFDDALASLRSDCESIARGEDLFSVPLWQNAENPLEDVWQEVVSKVKTPEWAFWIKWYQDALDGRPQNWPMLEQIALIDPEIWQAGAEAVAERIEWIRELHRLRTVVATLQAERDGFFSGAATAVHRAHNQPPDLVESDFDLARETTIIWAGLDDANQELEKDEPDKGVLRKIAEKILSAIASVIRYCGKVSNTAIMAAAKVIGGGGGTIALDYIVNNGRLLQFAKDLLNFSGGG